MILLTAETDAATLESIRRALPDADVVHRPSSFGWTAAQLLSLVHDADAVLAGGDEYTERVLAHAPRLRILARLGVGFDKVDVTAAERLGIYVTSTPGANSVAVAELAIGLILAMARDVVGHAVDVKQNRWAPSFGTQLEGQTLGLIGSGAIGSEVLKRALAFGMKVRVHDPFVSVDRIRSAGGTPSSLGDTLAEADFLSLHLPLSAATRGYLNRERIATVKRGCMLVNTARGDLIDEDALLEALNTGRIKAAALDVLRSEPPSGASGLLAHHPSTIVVPHIGAATREASNRTYALAIESVARAFAGERPPRAINDPLRPRNATPRVAAQP